MPAPELSAPDLSGRTDRELIVDLDRVEQAISSATTYVRDESPAGRAVSPEPLTLAEREEAITTELRRRRSMASDLTTAVHEESPVESSSAQSSSTQSSSAQSDLIGPTSAPAV